MELEERKVAALIDNKVERKFDRVIEFDIGIFTLLFDIDKRDEEVVYKFTKEINPYRLKSYFERKNEGDYTHHTC